MFKKGSRGTARWVVASIGTVAAMAMLPTGASSHPGEKHSSQASASGALGVLINSPAEHASFHPGVTWTGSGAVDFQTAEFVYAGSGCSLASYAPVAAQVPGKIALIDDRAAADGTDPCPTYTFAQKVQSAEKAGAIGLVQIPREGDEPAAGSAIAAEIPAMEVERTPALLAARDAVIAGTAVNATLTRPVNFDPMSDLPCTDGKAGPFECDGIDLLSFVPQEDFNGAGVSDMWGWTDPDNGDEYVFLGKTNGVAFFRVTDPKNPVYLGELPNDAVNQQIWHDMKVYENHAFIVSESEPHGMTVFDLTRLRGVTEARVWDQDAFYPLHSAAHNIAINEDTGYAYIVGGNAGIVVPDQCMSGLHMVNIQEPKQPIFAGCYLEEGGPGTLARTVGDETVMENSPAAYVHDTECVVYKGPDTRYTGREICFNAAEDVVVVADVTDKLAPVTLGYTSYPNVAYAHQGSLTADQRYLLVNDELDETTVTDPDVVNTRTIVLDVSDLQNPKLHFEHVHGTRSIDHNNYVHEGLAYQSNYTSGLQVLDVANVGDPDSPRLERRAFFDTYPTHSEPTFDGTWSNYPYFKSGTVAVSGIGEGLFLLALQRGVDAACGNCPVSIRAGENGTAQLTVTNTGALDDSYRLTLGDVPAGWSATLDTERLAIGADADKPATATIGVPKNQQAGTHTLTLTVTSVADPSITASAPIEVTVTKGKPLGLLGG